MTLKMRGFDKLEKKKILRQSILTQNGDSRARSNLRHCFHFKTLPAGYETELRSVDAVSLTKFLKFLNQLCQIQSVGRLIKKNNCSL